MYIFHDMITGFSSGQLKLLPRAINRVRINVNKQPLLTSAGCLLKKPKTNKPTLKMGSNINLLPSAPLRLRIPCCMELKYCVHKETGRGNIYC